MKISTIESMTGGLLASKITSIPGSSKIYVGSVIAYSNQIKEKLNIRTTNGVISKEVALQMAAQGNIFFDSDICIAITGNAGPTSLDKKPVGLVYVAINEKCYKLILKGTRDNIRNQACDFAWKKIKKNFNF